MRSLLIIVIGLLVVRLMRYLAPGGRYAAMWGFSLVWLLVCAWNLSVGLSHGYALGEELLVHAFLFAIPVGFGWWKVAGRTS
ncbi:hypothetical protein HCU01_22140 [Halomonas cupida]|uniref:Uncharacterized protein n=1 Tax=Halomonas cupida TaxID=44933 RepID=A0A1M7J0D4_9GAMM|nr:hypothetical protein [Halomonas cupida]GEN24265.1 hypothetical protein HCU01_22140 [Halomonas cupida]SHM46544.1 hypothetical protein SAMN05660971_03058 [Halomonas cupida]